MKHHICTCGVFKQKKKILTLFHKYCSCSPPEKSRGPPNVVNVWNNKKICQSSFLNLYIYLKLVDKVSEAFEISICKSYLFHSLTFVNFDTESYIIIYILYKYILYIILFKLFKLFKIFKIILTNLRLPLDSLQVAKASWFVYCWIIK